MSRRRTAHMLLTVAIAACLGGLSATPAVGQTAPGPAPDRALVERAVDDLEAAQLESARIDARVAQARKELDGVLAQQQQARDRLDSRARMMYLSGDSSFVWVLLGSEDFQDFASRWSLLMRMSQQDAADLDTLRTAREDAEQTAKSLMALQAEQARVLDDAADTVARARRELAASEAALRDYEARVAEEAKQAAAASAATPSDSTPQISGTGAWQTGVASHYGRSFTGRGASGQAIGPYSMMVAHRTLPFGTLVEFEYDGKRAVASVEDRGPHSPDRMWDLGPGVVRALDFGGVHEVRYRVIGD